MSWRSDSQKYVHTKIYPFRVLPFSFGYIQCFSTVKKCKNVKTPILSLNNKFLRGIILQYLKLLVSFAAINPPNIFRFCQFAINIKYKKNIDFPIFLIDILHVSKPFRFSSNIFCYKFPRKNYLLSCQFSYVLAIKISFKMSLFFSVF